MASVTDENIRKDWQYLQTSDHFYYMSTKWFSDGDVHKYFNPYESPYDAFINYMNILTDFSLRLENIHIDVQDEMDDIKESVQKITRKTGDVIKKTVNTTSKKVKVAIDKGKEINFEDMKHMSDAAIKKVLKEIDIETVTIALKDTKDDLVDRVLPNLGAKARKQYDALQDEVKKVKKSDIKKYQKEIEKKLNELFRK